MPQPETATFKWHGATHENRPRVGHIPKRGGKKEPVYETTFVTDNTFPSWGTVNKDGKFRLADEWRIVMESDKKVEELLHRFHIHLYDLMYGIESVESHIQKGHWTEEEAERGIVRREAKIEKILSGWAKNPQSEKHKLVEPEEEDAQR